MQASFYVPKWHKPVLDNWHKVRDQVPPESTPNLGWVAIDEKDKPLAMIFLLRAEKGVGIVDGLIANPNVKGEQRAEALNLLIKTMLESAKKLGFDRIVSWTSNASTLMKAVNHGFKPQGGQTLLAIEIKRGE